MCIHILASVIAMQIHEIDIITYISHFILLLYFLKFLHLIFDTYDIYEIFIHKIHVHVSLFMQVYFSYVCNFYNFIIVNSIRAISNEVL